MSKGTVKDNINTSGKELGRLWLALEIILFGENQQNISQKFNRKV